MVCKLSWISIHPLFLMSSANVFQIEINVQSLLLKHKDDSVDDLAEDEETTLGNPSDDFDEDDEYGAVMMDFSASLSHC
ncbi:hypothetical protein SLA2020_276910 [Shorea laevis]